MKNGFGRAKSYGEWERGLFLDDAHFVVFCKKGAESFVAVKLLDIVRQFVDGGVDVLVYPVEWFALLALGDDAIAGVFGTIDLCGGVAVFGEFTGVFVPCAISDFPFTASTETFCEGAVDDNPSPTRSVCTESSVTRKVKFHFVGCVCGRFLVNELPKCGGELSCAMSARRQCDTGTSSNTHCPLGYEIIEFLNSEKFIRIHGNDC